MENEKLHTKALRVFADMKPTQSIERAQNVVRDFNALRREHVETHVRPILIEMQAAFERGETLAGAPSLKQWCRVFKSEGVLSFARCRQILTGKSGNENKAVKSLDPNGLVGSILTIGGEQFKVVGMDKDVRYVPEKIKTHSAMIGLQLVPVEELGVAAPAPKKSRKSLCEKCGKRKPRKATLCDACKNPQWKEPTEESKPDLIVVEFTKAQMREVEIARMGINGIMRPTVKDIRFRAAEYPEEAKVLVLALEARIEKYVEEIRSKVESGEYARDLMNWNNKSDEAMAVKKDRARLNGMIKACDGAISQIVSGDLESEGNEGRDLYDWSNARDEANWKVAMDAAYAPGGAAEPLSEPAKALAATEKANKRSKGTSGEPAATAATTALVKMARIGNTNEFGVFPESCWKCTTANALTIGTRQVCEAERDRINAKRPAKNDSVENLVTHGDAQQNQQQHPAAEALEKALDSTEAVEVSDEQHDEEQCDYSEEQVAAMFAQGSELPEL
jgi:hypothetical protein